jgi:hypothetical protein
MTTKNETFISLLLSFVRGGCQISHSFWVYRKPLSVSSNQEVNICNNEDRLSLVVNDVVIFSLKDYNFRIDNGDLIIEADQPELYTTVTYRIKKDPAAQSSMADLKAYLCHTVPKSVFIEYVNSTVLYNLAYDEDELKKQIAAKKFELNQLGIYHAAYSDDFMTHIIIPNITVIDFTI